MKLRTSKNLEYDVKWAGVSITRARQMLIQMNESKPLVTLISELDGIDWAMTSGPKGQPDKKIEGLMRLISASRMDNGDVLITLEKEGNGGLTVSTFTPATNEEGESA